MLSQQTPKASLRLNRFPGIRRYRLLLPDSDPSLNPSIAANGDGFLAIVRTINCVVDDRGNYLNIPETGLGTTNWLVELGPDMQMKSACRLDDSKAREGESRARGGFEDARLFRWRGRWWFVASALSSYSPAATTMVLCALQDGKVSECHFMPSPLAHGLEKKLDDLRGGVRPEIPLPDFTHADRPPA